MSRRGAEFPAIVKDAEKLDWHRRHPNNGKQKLEVHHILPIEDGVRLGVPKEALSTRRNAIALTKEDHQEAHRFLDEETKNTLAGEFIKIFARLF